MSHCFPRRPDEYKILAAAVALRARGRRPPVGDHLVQETLQRLTERAEAAGVEELALWGLVHKRNAASQQLVQRHGFVYVADFDEDHQEWWLPPIEILQHGASAWLRLPAISVVDVAGLDLAGGVVVGLGDELLELGEFDVPLAAAAELERGQVAAAHERGHLGGAGGELVGDL